MPIFLRRVEQFDTTLGLSVVEWVFIVKGILKAKMDTTYIRALHGPSSWGRTEPANAPPYPAQAQLGWWTFPSGPTQDRPAPVEVPFHAEAPLS